MLILQGLNPETGDLDTFVEHWEQSKTTYNIAVAKSSASDEYSDTKRHKNCSKFKERVDNGKKYRKKNTSLYCSLHGENKSHTSRECNILKKRAKDKDNLKYGKKEYKKKFKELNLLKAKSSQQKSKYEKYKQIFCQEEDFQGGDCHSIWHFGRNSSSISEADNSPDEYEKTSIAYDSESSDKDKSSSSFIISEENNWPNGCRDSFIIDKLKPNSKSNIKYHRLSFNHLDKALVYSHLLNTLQSPTNKIYKQI